MFIGGENARLFQGGEKRAGGHVARTNDPTGEMCREWR